MVPLPLPVVDAWGSRAIGPLSALFVMVASGLLLYIRAIVRAERIDANLLLAAIAAALVTASAVPALFSADLYAYLAYGERALRGCDPWSFTSACADGPLATLARLAWHHDPPRLVYGPLDVVVAALLAPLARVSPMLAIDAWRAVVDVAFLLAVARIARIYGIRAAVILGANPVAIWTVAEGHNDALMLLAITFALGMKSHARNVWWIAAAAVKGIAVIPAIVHNLRRPGRLATIVLATLACYAPLIVDLIRAGGIPVSTTISYDLASLIAPIPHGAAQVLVAIFLTAALFVACPRNERITTAVLIAWCLLPNAYPWYALWILPVAALFWGTPSASALVVAAICALVRYIPDATLGNDPALRSSIVLMQFLPPLAIAAAARLRIKRLTAATSATAAIAVLAVLGACARTEPVHPQPTAPGPVASAPGQPAPAPQFAYIVTPPAEPSAVAGDPRILEIALNAQTLVSPGPVLVRITTTTDVVSVIARALGREITIQQASPGIFSGGETIPRVPFFMRKSYEVEIVAANAAGRTARASVPVTLR